MEQYTYEMFSLFTFKRACHFYNVYLTGFIEMYALSKLIEYMRSKKYTHLEYFQVSRKITSNIPIIHLT